MTLLSVKGLTKNFGGLCAVSNVSMEIGEGELIGLIGPNGAGKTTFFNLLTGVYEPSEGTIELNVNGKMTDIAGMKPYRVTQLGLARTFQNIRLFKSMTAIENVKIAMHKDIRYGCVSDRKLVAVELHLDDLCADRSSRLAEGADEPRAGACHLHRVWRHRAVIEADRRLSGTGVAAGAGRRFLRRSGVYGRTPSEGRISVFDHVLFHGVQRDRFISAGALARDAPIGSF